MAKAIAAFHYDGVVYDPERNPEVPDDVARKVGSHLLDEPVFDDEGEEGEGGPGFDGEAFDAAVEAKAKALLEEAVTESLTTYKAREQAAYDALADQDEPFDPAGDKVTAPQVKAYLEGLDRGTVNGQAEFDRVVELEKEGQNRSSALPG